MPGPELPKPERNTPIQNTGEYVVPYPEDIGQAPIGERISQASSAVAQATASSPAAVIPITPVMPATPIAPTTNNTTTPAVADDVDVIEKEWVEKAKQIVAKTKSDPHLQSTELTIFKHDYMKKRYGKELKLPDERAA